MTQGVARLRPELVISLGDDATPTDGFVHDKRLVEGTWQQCPTPPSRQIVHQRRAATSRRALAGHRCRPAILSRAAASLPHPYEPAPTIVAGLSAWAAGDLASTSNPNDLTCPREISGGELIVLKKGFQGTNGTRYWCARPKHACAVAVVVAGVGEPPPRHGTSPDDLAHPECDLARSPPDLATIAGAISPSLSSRTAPDRSSSRNSSLRRSSGSRWTWGRRRRAASLSETRRRGAPLRRLWLVDCACAYAGL